MRRIPQILLICALILSSTSMLPALPGRAAAANLGPTGQDNGPVAPGSRIFLPLVLAPYVLTGKVVGANGLPVAGVTITDQNGQSALTGADGQYRLMEKSPGNYTLVASKAGEIFSPSALEVGPHSGLVGQDFTSLAACTDQMVNGGFETNAGWFIPVTPHPAQYSSLAAHSGARSMLTGIISGSKNVYSYSDATSGQILIPSGTGSATLRVWLYTQSQSPTTDLLPAFPEGLSLDSLLNSMPQAGAAPEAADANVDSQYVLLLDQNQQILQTLLRIRRNDLQWRLYEFNLSQYAGRRVYIHVGTYNNGSAFSDGLTSMYVDDASLETCPTTAFTCGNQFLNSDFETRTGWNIPATAFSAGYTSSPVYNGVSAMRMGVPTAAQNKFSYSDAWQSVTIPKNATTARLSLWVYPVSTESGATTSTQTAAPTMDLNQAFSTQALTVDTQYILVLDSFGNILEALTWWQPSNAATWTYLEFSLLRYAGQTIRIQPGVFNNGTGGVTALYMDDAVMDVCNTGTPTPTPTPGPTPVPSPTPTVNPGACTERFLNTGFEHNQGWEIPITAFSAGYSTTFAHAEARSMRTGIYYTVHNRFSYSDFRQEVTIPANTTQAIFSAWLWPMSGTGAAQSASLDEPLTSDLQPDTLTGDVQYILVLDAFGNWIDTLLWQRVDSGGWTQWSTNLTRYAGRTIQLQFGTYNNGTGSVSAMYVDDASLQACP